MSAPVNPTVEQIKALAALELDGPVRMVNLLRFADGGREHYARYAREIAPILDDIGARVVGAGLVETQVIGDGPRPWWDAILTVEYPSVAAFLGMLRREDYGPVHEHRERALERAELIATSLWQPGA